MKSIFTDINGKSYQNTVPSGLVQPGIWNRQVENFIPQMDNSVAELISKATHPFVTKINDFICDESLYFDGHVLLVGDALFSIRSNAAVASEQAALQCLLLEKVWRGEISSEAWHREISIFGKSMVLFSRAWGGVTLGTFFQALKSTVGFLWFVLKAKLRLV
jgi:hypothetical protein